MSEQHQTLEKYKSSDLISPTRNILSQNQLYQKDTSQQDEEPQVILIQEQEKQENNNTEEIQEEQQQEFENRQNQINAILKVKQSKAQQVAQQEKGISIDYMQNSQGQTIQLQQQQLQQQQQVQQSNFQKQNDQNNYQNDQENIDIDINNIDPIKEKKIGNYNEDNIESSSNSSNNSGFFNKGNPYEQVQKQNKQKLLVKRTLRQCQKSYNDQQILRQMRVSQSFDPSNFQAQEYTLKLSDLAQWSKHRCYEELKIMNKQCQNECRISDFEFYMQICITYFILLLVNILGYLISIGLGIFLTVYGLFVLYLYFFGKIQQRRSVLKQHCDLKTGIQYYTILNDIDSSDDSHIFWCNQCVENVQTQNNMINYRAQKLLNMYQL